MATVVAAVVLIGVLMLIMALGAMIKGNYLRGSCGGATGACECSPAKKARCEVKATGITGRSLAKPTTEEPDIGRDLHLPVIPEDMREKSFR